MEDFGQGLQQLIEKTLAGKTEELKRREIEVTQREERIDLVLKRSGRGHCEIRVGNYIFHTTCETLTRVPESYFASGLLDTSMIKDGKLSEPVFIDRDGEVFKFVLEYLQYGQIYTPIPNNGFLRKLEADAKYYLLPELLQQLESKGIAKVGEEGAAYLSLSSKQSCAVGQFVVWNGTHTAHFFQPSHFTLSPDFKKVTFSVSGLYQIHVRLGQTNSSNSNYLGLQVDGVDVAQCLQSDANLHQNTAQITEILQIDAESFLQVRCGANNHSLANELQSRLFIVLLAD
jgi:hypothetical protein